MTTLNAFLRLLTLASALFMSFGNLSAADPVAVKKVDFTTARLPGGSQTDEWIEVLIELQGGPNVKKRPQRQL